MNCWDVLGIESTQNRSSIDEAYNQQVKFVSNEDAVRLDEAYRDALVQAGFEAEKPPVRSEEKQEPARVLSPQEHQVVREVVIQIEALLNDDGRRNDPAIWRAILASPPADDTAVKQQVADRLESRIRPLARNGGLPAPVAHYLGSWFGWPELVDALPVHVDAGQEAHPTIRNEEPAEDQEFEKPQVVNFWPAVIGWIAGLIILTILFSGMGGGG